jgi:hypothetical protein
MVGISNLKIEDDMKLFACASALVLGLCGGAFSAPSWTAFQAVNRLQVNYATIAGGNNTPTIPVVRVNLGFGGLSYAFSLKDKAAELMYSMLEQAMVNGKTVSFWQDPNSKIAYGWVGWPNTQNDPIVIAAEMK